MKQHYVRTWENHTTKASCCSWRAQGLIILTLESHTSSVGVRHKSYTMQLGPNIPPHLSTTVPTWADCALALWLSRANTACRHHHLCRILAAERQGEKLQYQLIRTSEKPHHKSLLLELESPKPYKPHTLQLDPDTFIYVQSQYSW